jgi:hypothetical protein
MDAARIGRMSATFAAAWAVLYVRFSAGIFPSTEVDPYVHWALLPIALLIGAANAAAEINGSGSTSRRDGLWGLCAALVSFAIAHGAKLL